MESRLPVFPVTYQGIPPPGVTPKGVCHHGTYLDQTNGILTCRDAHKAHELSPNVSLFEKKTLSPNVNFLRHNGKELGNQSK
jgi:hypothetical protein